MTVPTNHPSLPLAFQSHPQAWLHALWKFSRPHTIIGTSLSVFSLYFIALAESKNLPPQVARLLNSYFQLSWLVYGGTYTLLD